MRRYLRIAPWLGMGILLPACSEGTGFRFDTDAGVPQQDASLLDVSGYGADVAPIDSDIPDLQGWDGPDLPIDSGAPAVTINTYPRVDGSTSTLPLGMVIACELLGLPWKWEETWNESNQDLLMQVVPDPQNTEQEMLAQDILQTVVHTRTHNAYMRLIDDETDLILVASLPSPEEKEHAEQKEVVLEAHSVAWDALVFLVNGANPITGLTANEVRGIFLGQIEWWSAVGGPVWPIHPYVRPPNSGSQQLMESVVMEGQTLPDWPEDQQATFMGGLIDKIETDSNAIGYSVFYYVTHMVETEQTKMIAIDGQAPTPPTITAGSYPFRTPVWVVTRRDLASDSMAAQLRDWLLAPGGQAVVDKSGYVPILR